MAIRASTSRWIVAYPVVIVDGPRRDGAGHVTIDDRAAAALAARHVLELGHRDLAVIASALVPDGFAGQADAARQEA
ncbi:hypothetical protein [Fodinicola acaciae]|uniref:hypothetical protein n=1 Tax=Fodinicola acaciae TaxID=2681555 RepID=UPI0013D33887|nr:hypothetical protein [Fodinicola acaciae]